MASASRLVSLFRYGAALIVFWLLVYIILVSFKLEILKEFRKEQFDLKSIQEKFVALNFNNKALVEPDLELDEELDRQPNKKPNQEPDFEPDKQHHPEPDDDEPRAIELEDGITETARSFIEKLGLKNPGENGDPVQLPSNLSKDIQDLIKDGYDKNGYNAFISAMVSLNRNIPDVRSDWCKKQTYTNLPKCSILIPFHNEDWMLLMRTIHSILSRSPQELIEEIILIDDVSDRENLLDPLNEQIKKYPNVKIIRSYRRLGIISNRMLGAINAIGPVLIYVDSHVEVSPGWLEPILDRFAQDMNVVVWPRISSIDKNTLQMYLNYEDAGSIGGFAWNMDFNWINIKWYEGDHPTQTWEPKRSPTVIGALYAISKKFFMHVGMLDPEFDIWGGEDVELSFKAWLCGGKVEYVPCSFVAHMYKSHKYTWPATGKGGYRWNTDRIAEVWLDEYKRYYYRSVGDTKDRNFGDISERVEIRKKIGCKPFKWFIDNIYPNVPIPDNIKDPPTNSTDKKN